ncbi:MAG TPA: hypothetical protein VFR36_04470 [Sphingomicrobium sp.]|nr:hypothetical protein [Sphingomicrobium sp.]
MTQETQTSTEAPTVVRIVQVDVYAYREGDDILFSHAWRRQGDPNRRKGKIVIPHGEGDVPIHFHLHDRSQLNLSFLANPADAMWVDLNDCPTGAGNGNQINFVHSSPNLLRVEDDNSDPPCTLHFALRFAGDPTPSGGPPYEYDPEIRNGGGG